VGLCRRGVHQYRVSQAIEKASEMTVERHCAQAFETQVAAKNFNIAALTASGRSKNPR
jgi:hypothetical protein